MSSNKNIGSFEPQPKLSSSTFLTDLPTPCECPRLEPDTLRNKLEQILLTLQEQIDLRTHELNLERQCFQDSLREKDEIIERLVEANNTLCEENRALQISKKSDRQRFEIQLKQFQQSFAAQRNELAAVINYLELRSQELARQLTRFNTPKPTNIKASRVFDSCLTTTFSQLKPSVIDPTVASIPTLKKVNSANCLLQQGYFNPCYGQTQSEIKFSNLRHMKKSRLDFQKIERGQTQSRVSNPRVVRNLNQEEWRCSRAY